jgi:hypothetical protein
VFVPWGVMNWPSGVKTSLARRLPASGLLESASEKKRFIRSWFRGGWAWRARRLRRWLWALLGRWNVRERKREVGRNRLVNDKLLSYDRSILAIKCIKQPPLTTPGQRLGKRPGQGPREFKIARLISKGVPGVIRGNRVFYLGEA